MESKNYILFISIIIISLLFFAGCITKPINETNTTKTLSNISRFSSCNAIIEKFNKNNNDSLLYYEQGIRMFKSFISPTSSGFSSAPIISKNLEYSTTNIQVTGVDEADFVKTDGNYIYTISKGKLIIVEAYPVKNAKLISSINVGDNIQPLEIFVNSDTIIVFGSRAFDVSLYKLGSDMQEKYSKSYSSFTVIQLWNISDRENPKLIKTSEFEGQYISSRMVNSTVYFVITQYPYYSANPKEVMPLYREYFRNEDRVNYSSVAKCNEVGYFQPVNAQNFIILGAMSIQNYSAPISKEVIVGSGENIYASTENVYVADVNYDDLRHIFWRGIIPVEPQSREKTTVHKFSFSGNRTSYVGSMDAPGHILNQFSMDEHNGDFRIATTIGGSNPSTNNVYIFGGDLKFKGKLEGLAPSESIYSVRFMGDRAYLVTFKKVDPLFVIDLSDGSKPKVLGKLKIPGYSDYLHPIDKNHLIGIGKDTEEAEEGDFAWYQGIKMAVFDVTNVSKPKEMHKIIIGDRGTESYVLRDHKAFLYDIKKDLLVIPILLAEIDKEKRYNQNRQLNIYGDYVFQGAYVYNLTLENGFKLKGRITHLEDNETFDMSGYYYRNSGDSIKRSLYIDDILYTISDNKIIANSLNRLDLLKTIVLSK